MNNRLNILLISSESLSRTSSRLALDQYQALKASGHNVDVLTKFDDSGNPDVISVLDAQSSTVSVALWQRIVSKIKRFFCKTDLRSKYYFFYEDELHPPVATELVLNKIVKNYDFVLVSFWQGLLSAKTVWNIYEKLSCPILFLAVDMSPLTGGCHYFWDCQNFKTGCGCCPAIGSTNPHDFTNFNSQYRHEHFAKITGAFLGNDFMNEIAQTSYALQGFAIEKGVIVINESQFCPRDKSDLRKEFGIDVSKKFIIFAGAQTLTDKRKGMTILVESLNDFYTFLSADQRNEILLIFAGNATHELLRDIKFDTKSLGYVDFETLAKVYSVADVFLSPSILDAGPMMVNQSLSCGTPVVAFEMGCALEVIKGHNTGYCAKLSNVNDFTHGLNFIYNLDPAQRTQMSIDCREMAMISSSFKNFEQNTVKIYNKIKNGRA